MSVRTLTTLAVVRDTEKPKKGDIGKAKRDEEKTKEPTLLDLLVALVPTELVVPYTAAMAVIIGLIDKPTQENPNPDQYELWRWLLFLGLVAITAIYVYVDKRSKEESGQGRFPLPEMSGALVAAAGWGLALPNSPLWAHLDGKEPAAASAVIGFIALGINVVIANALKKSAAPAARR